MPAYFLALILGLLGLFIGSFLNVVVVRLHSGESFATGRSECPKCHHQLKWYELLPVVSYVAQRGRCRSCSKPISAQYPAMELLTGVVFASLAVHFAGGSKAVIESLSQLSIFSLGIWLVVASLLIVAAVYDAKWMLLPDSIMLPTIFIAILYVLALNTIFGQEVLIGRLIAALIFGVFFTTLWAVSSGKWLGDGDIRLAIIMGLMLSLPQLVVGVFFAFNIAAVVSIGLLVGKKKTRHDAVPLGPFLILGTFLGLMFGNYLMTFYLSA